jgi:hypothetical protein
MLKKDKFKQLLEEVEKIKRIPGEDGETLYWEVYDSGEALLGYAFYIEVPETFLETEDVDEFDRYEVWGIVDKNAKIIALDIGAHPDGPEKLWAQAIIEPEYTLQYIGLNADDIKMKEGGKIDAITDATISSKLIVEAIRNKIDEISAHI